MGIKAVHPADPPVIYITTKTERFPCQSI